MEVKMKSKITIQDIKKTLANKMSGNEKLTEEKKNFILALVYYYFQFYQQRGFEDKTALALAFRDVIGNKEESYDIENIIKEQKKESY